LDVNVPEVAADAIDQLNEVIHKHNRACDEFQARVVSARDRLALNMIASDLEEFVRLRDVLLLEMVTITQAEHEIERLMGEITQLEREIREHQQPAEELNEDLRKYLGHSELQLLIKDTGYSIMRNGILADMLSEGEMTAIALLYFLKSLESRDFDLTNGVVILDDPVSSLDQNSLFAAFGYVRARIQAASQVLVLTHNFMFFRLVREWFGHLRRQDRRAWQVYMLGCDIDGTCRMAKIRAIDRLLMDFDSEYHYLFARVYGMAREPQAATLETYYCAPSIARRVVETFLAFRVPDLGGHNRLWGQMQTVQFDDATKSRIYRFIQTHSHREVIGDADEDLTLLGESQAVLNDILAFMRAADAEHVSRMIARISTSSDAAGDIARAGAD
jgi:wobble nucleotide-excising tRNase